MKTRNAIAISFYTFLIVCVCILLFNIRDAAAFIGFPH